MNPNKWKPEYLIAVLGLMASMVALTKLEIKWSMNIDISSKPAVTEKSTPQETTPTAQKLELASKVSADYSQLEKLLASGKFQEADRETRRLMLSIAGREQERWLDAKSMASFPCPDLQAIDKLWQEYSDGRFGFSVQKDIWEAVGKDGDQFDDRVGWSENGKLRQYKELNWEVRSPAGHLPIAFWCGGGGCLSGDKQGWFSAPQMVRKCKIR